MPTSARKAKSAAATTLDELLGSSSEGASDNGSDNGSLALNPQNAERRGKSSNDSDETFGNVPVMAFPKMTTSPTKRLSTETKSQTVTTATAQPVSPQPCEENDEEIEDSFAVVLPSSWAAAGQPPPGDCGVLIQVDPEDAALLDYEGTSGAIGRFEAGPNGIVLDLKGRQYHGSLLPGPTVMMVALTKGKQLRVEGLTDEFASLVQTQDVMANMDAIVTGATMDDSYKVVDVNVNRVERIKEKGVDGEGANAANPKGGASAKGGGAKPAAKRRRKT